MSSRYDGPRRDRDRERGGRYIDRDAPPRRSRSRSPPRRGDRDRGGRPSDRREYDRDHRDNDRRDRGRDFDRRRDDRDRDRDGRDPRDDRRPPYEREPPRRDGDKDRDRERDKDRNRNAPRGGQRGYDGSERGAPRVDDKQATGAQNRKQPEDAKMRELSEAPTEEREEGEEMDVTNDEEAAMMAAMGIQGFGTTKGKHVDGNQEGSVEVKKMRTWRQYMNRRGGFNRPLDKIK